MTDTLQQFELLYPQDSIQQRVKEIAQQINTEYVGKPLVMICVLKGAFLFFADLVRNLTVEPEIDFVRIASYGRGSRSSRNISFTKDVEIALKDKHVIIVEDIVDTGLSMKFLLKQLSAREAKSIKLATLIDKHERREEDITVDYVGFTLLQKAFIVGYGLDYAEQYRELPAIYKAVLA